MDTQPAEPLADADADDATSKQQPSQASLTEAVASTGSAESAPQRKPPPLMRHQH